MVEPQERLRKLGGVRRAMSLGTCPDSKKPVFLRAGVGGWGVQAGLAGEDPTIVYAPLEVPPRSLSLEEAVRLLRLGGCDTAGEQWDIFRLYESAFWEAISAANPASQGSSGGISPI